MTLDQLRVGQGARVIALREDCSMKRRLQDLGLLPGAQVTALMKSPLGDPTAYAVCGAVIAIRRQDAKGVEIGI